MTRAAQPAPGTPTAPCRGPSRHVFAHLSVNTADAGFNAPERQQRALAGKWRKVIRSGSARNRVSELSILSIVCSYL